MPPQFKDFNKDAKDLLTKNYQAAGTWKLESKFKGADSTLFINPQVEGNVMSVDLEYGVKEFGLKTKATASVKGVDGKVTWESKPHKVEVDSAKQEITYELDTADFALTDKLNRTSVESSIAYQVCTPATVGAALSFDHQAMKIKSWAAGFRYKHGKDIVASITTEALTKYVTGLQLPFAFGDIKGKFAIQADCGKDTKYAAGVEIPCIFIPGNTYRLKVDSKKVITFAAIRKFADGWKAALTLDSNNFANFSKVGVYVVRE